MSFEVKQLSYELSIRKGEKCVREFAQKLIDELSDGMVKSKKYNILMKEFIGGVTEWENIQLPMILASPYIDQSSMANCICVSRRWKLSSNNWKLNLVINRRGIYDSWVNAKSYLYPVELISK